MVISYLNSSVSMAGSKGGFAKAAAGLVAISEGHGTCQGNGTKALAKPSTQEGSSRPALALAAGSCP